MKLAFTPSSPDFLMVVPDYHPCYGLADSTRAEVLRLVVVDGLPVREAAALRNLHYTTVYKWLADARRSTQTSQKDL